MWFQLWGFYKLHSLIERPPSAGRRKNLDSSMPRSERIVWYRRTGDVPFIRVRWYHVAHQLCAAVARFINALVRPIGLSQLHIKSCKISGTELAIVWCNWIGLFNMFIPNWWCNRDIKRYSRFSDDEAWGGSAEVSQLSWMLYDGFPVTSNWSNKVAGNIRSAKYIWRFQI